MFSGFATRDGDGSGIPTPTTVSVEVLFLQNTVFLVQTNIKLLQK